MQYKAFSITLYALEFSRAPKSAELLEMPSVRMLQSLRDALNQKVLKSSRPERIAQSIDGSLFCCCLPEGMAMLRAESKAPDYHPVLRGFLVPQEFLRTAWRLCRVQLLYLCAGGLPKREVATLMLSEIDSLAGSVRIATREESQRLAQMTDAMLNSEMPFSFAMTRVPQNLLPLLFPPLPVADTAIAFETEEDVRLIRIQREHCQPHLQRLAQDFYGFSDLTLCMAAKKKFPDVYSASNHYNLEEQKKYKAEAKEKLQNYLCDRVWYFEISFDDQHYARLLSKQSCEQLDSGFLDFATLYHEMMNFRKYVSESQSKLLAKKEKERQKMDAYFGESEAGPKPAQNADLPRPRPSAPSPAPKQEEPKKKGLFKNLFGK